MDGDGDWLERDAPFMQNDLHGPLDGPCWLMARARRPILFTAVHGVVHHRPVVGAKSAEARTGGLALALGAAMDAAAAVVLRSTGAPDANFDPDHPFKQALLAQGFIRPGVGVMDLHGMTND